MYHIFVGSLLSCFTRYQQIPWVCSLDHNNLFNSTWFTMKFHNHHHTTPRKVISKFVIYVVKNTQQIQISNNTWRWFMKRKGNTLAIFVMLSFTLIINMNNMWKVYLRNYFPYILSPSYFYVRLRFYDMIWGNFDKLKVPLKVLKTYFSLLILMNID